MANFVQESFNICEHGLPHTHAVGVQTNAFLPNIVPRNTYRRERLSTKDLIVILIQNKILIF